MKIISLSVWFVSALAMLPVFLYVTTIADPSGQETCNIIWGHNVSSNSSSDVSQNEQTAFALYSFINGFLAPLAFIVLFYFLVLCRLHSLKPIKDGKISENKRQLHQKVTKLVLTVVSVYTVCWLPHWTVQMVLICQPPDSQQHTGLMVTVLLTTCLAYAPKGKLHKSSFISTITRFNFIFIPMTVIGIIIIIIS